mgnify:CR=1 FL=1
MNNGLQFLDILIFAMVAGFLLLRLRRALGRRTGNEQPPQLLHDNKEMRDTVVKMPSPGGSADGPSDEEEEPSSDSGLTQVKIADPNFDDNVFLDGAGAAFEIILGAFARGDKVQLRGLLDDTTYQNFLEEIERREGARERLETTLVSMIRTDITEAKMVGASARVTVKFVSEQVNVTRNEADEVVAGDASDVATINDVWTFARDTRSKDPNWQLVETRAID